ncbi:MAG: hypothetical protein HN352_00815 [Bacteroidetes bacterium]|jgi:hypothetical protein|nr:hypothetical protein [Bacteroidota bacterium]MBT3751522.1 hypothetical protein [Bacteroidota bacterium]MBT4398059.1 hypothetical protein [Bacteroidota bacterium]MBT4409939.1 hypothetical protein [Bacteroidota bacterium]MBT7463163.1 hypothetical protein [Bacteroidota bacterium]
MKIRNRFILALLIPVLYLGFSSCEKDGGLPTIRLTSTGSFVSADTMLMVGDSIEIGIEVVWNGVNDLKKMEIAINGQLASTSEISINQTQFQITIVKGLDDLETWTFSVFDDKNNLAELDLVLTKDPNSLFGPIKYFDAIRLGAQDNFNIPGFLGIETTNFFDIESAFLNQSSVDMLFYYDESDKACIASPGANIGEDIIGGSYSLANWNTRNTSEFIQTELSAAEFDGIFHDGLFITQFDADLAKRKAKLLEVGHVYLFQTESGLLGIFYVKQLINGVDGEIEIAIKVQAD